MKEAILSVVLVVLVATMPMSGAVAATDASDANASAAVNSTFAANAAELPERWNKTIGGSGDDKLSDAVRVEDGYLVVGWSNSTSTDDEHDGYVAMVDRSGRTTWERTYGGPGVDRVFDVKQVEDGYLLAGLSSEATGNWDGWLLKIDREGDVQWEQTYGDGSPAVFWSLARSGDSIYAAGYKKDSTTEAWVMKLDSDGDEVWNEDYDTLRSGTDEYVNSIFTTDDGDLLLTGTIEGGSGTDPADAWVLKLSDTGEREWQKDYGGAHLDKVHDAAAADDGGYVLAGRSASHGDGVQDGWLLKVADDGEKQWERTYGTDKDDALYGVTRDEDGGYVFTGAMNKKSSNGADGWLLRTDADGQKQWEKTFGNRAWDKFWPAIEGHGGGYLAVGDTTSYSEDRDGWLVRVGGPSVSAIEDAAPDAAGSTVMVEGSPVESITLADANASGVLTVTEEADLSALSPPGEPVYAVTVSGPEAAADDSATVEFSVPTDGLDGTADDLRVVQQTDDGWTVLTTSVVSEANGTATVSARANGTGTFAVTTVEAPSANLAADESVLVGEELSLDASDSSAENGTLASYQWTVGGDTYSGESVGVTFDELGEHTVNLTVTDDVGLRDTATASIVVNDEPSATLDGPDSATVGEAASFSADVSDEVGDVTVTWQFDDGKMTGESVEHSFTEPGTKTVTVVVADEYGATVTKELSVSVGQQESPATDDDGDGDGGSGAIPGFTPVGALVALVAAALLAYRTSR